MTTNIYGGTYYARVEFEEELAGVTIGSNKGHAMQIAETVAFVFPTFDKEELLHIFEFARVAMADGDIFDQIGEDMDLADVYLMYLREKLNEFMEENNG